jgi:hypothetical protein
MISLGSQPDWTKSSHSTGQNNCVIVRSVRLDTVDVGDSKISGGPALHFSPDAFAAFTKIGETWS